MIIGFVCGSPRWQRIFSFVPFVTLLCVIGLILQLLIRAENAKTALFRATTLYDLMQYIQHILPCHIVLEPMISPMGVNGRDESQNSVMVRPSFLGSDCAPSANNQLPACNCWLCACRRAAQIWSVRVVSARI